MRMPAPGRPNSANPAVPCRVPFLILMLLAVLGGTLHGQSEDSQWWNGFGRAGTTGRIDALAIYEGDLVVAGDFAYAGGTKAFRVARWNGSEWEPLGEGLGCPVHALAVYGGELYAGGECEDRGWPGDPCNDCVHRWNGASWEAVGITGIMGFEWPVIYSVNALQVHDGKLYAGGYFYKEGGNPGNFLLRWDGEAWTPMEFTLNGPVNSMVVYDGSLVVGGRFTRIDTSTVNRIVAWGGATWKPLGTGMDPGNSGDSIAVYCLHVYGDRLIAGGNFTEAGGVAVDRLASWDGTAWNTLGFEAGEISDPNGPRVTALATYDGDLIAGGVFEQAGGAPGDYVAAWNGVGWDGLSLGMDAQVRSIIEHEGWLYAGGDFRFADDVPVYHVAGWDGVSWHSLGPEGMGLSGCVRALAGQEGQIFAGGDFEIAGDTGANHIACWNGAEWDSIGSGFVHPVREVAVCDGRLYGVSEPFVGIGSKLIKQWNGAAWEPFGLEFPNSVNVITSYEGKLLVGGYDIAFWTGSSWDSFGRAKKGHVRDFIVFDDELIAGGYFPAILVGDGEIAALSVAAWREGVWHSIGQGLEGPHGWQEAQVYDLLIYEDDLIAAGIFRHSGGAELRHVAVWNGTDWESMGTGVNGLVYALAPYNETVIAGGEFTEAGGAKANHIARWNGSEWSPLGSGVDSTVTSLWVEDGFLYAGGGFKIAGGHASYYMARWEDRFPGMVLRFRAALADTAVRLEWANPSAEVFEGTLIRFSMDAYPAGPEDGMPVPNGNEGRFTGSAGRDTSFMHTGLKEAGTYYYTAFAYDGDPDYSTPAHASAVVPDVFAPHLTVAVFQNPYLSQYIDVYLIGSESLDPSSVELLIDNEATPIRPVDASNALWLADHKMKATDDSVAITGCASDYAQNEACVASCFRVSPVEGGGPRIIASLDGRLHLVIDSGSISHGKYVLILPCRQVGSEEGLALPSEGAVLLPDDAERPGGYYIGPPDVLEDCTAHVEFHYTSEDLAPDRTTDQLYIEQVGSGRLDCYLDSEGQTVSAEVKAAGTFRLRCGDPGSSKIADVAFLDMGPCRPNPFSTHASVRYEIRAAQPVRVSIYDCRGRRVVQLLDTMVPPGSRDLTWDGANADSQLVPSGVYFLRVETDHRQARRKLTLIR
jgi:hypothetical protein